MAIGTRGFAPTLLSISIAAALTGCGGPSVTENPIPSAAGDTPNNPSFPNPGGTNPGNNNPGNNNPGNNNPGGSNPGGTNPGGVTNPGDLDPGTTTPPPTNEAIGDPATATANMSVLTTTRTTVYNLNTTVLGASGWRPTALLENENSTGSGSPRVGFDASGNGLAVWVQGGDVLVSRYTASSASWSSPVALDDGIDGAHQSRVAVDRNTGNAIAIWTQSDGVAESIYATRFTASSNSWSAPQVLEASNGAVDSLLDNASVSIAGSHAAVVWRQHDGTANSAYLSRLVAGSWTTPALIDPNNYDAQQPQVAIDSNGNALVVWRQIDPAISYYRILGRRWDNATQTLGAVEALNNNGDRLPHVQVDAQGNAMVLWGGGGVFARRFDVTTGLWGNEVTLHNEIGNTWNAQLSVDAAGNALTVWVESDGAANSIYARRYLAASGTWGSIQPLENSNASVNTDEYPTVSLSGNSGVVAWVQGGATQDLYSSKLNDGTWETATLLETETFPTMELTSTADAAGNAAVVWVQSDNNARSIYQARYATSNVVVPAGGTWQSIANGLYGVNSVEAGNALQAAMGGGAISAGMILSGFPATLSVTTTIPAYYTVLSTDTWAHVAQRVYGVTDAAAIARLQTLLGNPTLSAGMQLEVPTTIQYTSSADFRAPLDWTRVVTTTTTYHQLDADLLTVPLENWSTAEQLDTTVNTNAIAPHVVFDADGNGIAVWVQADDLIARRYNASTGQWSAPIALDSNPNEVLMPRLAIDRDSGNAIASWVQSDGVAASMYVSSFDASNNSWSAAQLLETSNNAVMPSPSISMVSMAGEHAAITWLQSDGTANNDVYLSRLVAGTWSAPVVVDSGGTPGLSPEVAVDGNGNVIVAWRQLNPSIGQNYINTRRWDNTALAFGAVTAMSNNGDRIPRVGLDAHGDGVLLWRGGLGDGLWARHYDIDTNQWGPELQLHTTPGSARNGELAVDASGDALISWSEVVSGVSTIYSRYYDASAGTWGAANVLDNNNDASYMSVSLYGHSGVVTWMTEEGGPQDIYAAALRDGNWGAATLLETNSNRSRSGEITSAIDADGKATVVWAQADTTALSVFMARSDTSPYFVVPAAATWQSLANALYGVNSAAAAEALETALSNPTLTTGLHLFGLPEQLVVTPTVPTHYIVLSGDTWQSIALALYGTNRSEAATALWDFLGRPTLTVGQQLIIPSELAYTIED